LELSVKGRPLLADQAEAAQIAALVTRAKGGDSLAFDRLVELHASAVYNLALRVTRSQEEAEDCVQEAFVRAYTGLRNFRGEAAFATWLYRVALNVAREAYKKRGRAPLAATELASDDPDESVDLDQFAADGPQHETPEHAAIASQRRELVLRAVAGLPPHHREVIALYDLQGLSYEEIATVLQLRVGTVKSRLNRARLALKEALADHVEWLRE